MQEHCPPWLARIFCCLHFLLFFFLFILFSIVYLDDNILLYFVLFKVFLCQFKFLYSSSFSFCFFFVLVFILVVSIACLNLFSIVLSILLWHFVISHLVGRMRVATLCIRWLACCYLIKVAGMLNMSVEVQWHWQIWLTLFKKITQPSQGACFLKKY